MSRPIVHIGLPKTGTTTIQNVVSRLPGVMAIGKPLNSDHRSELVFHGKCLAIEEFNSIHEAQEAQIVITDWRRDYNDR